MKKRRLQPPYEFVWEDEEGMLHICEYPSCEDGCECEKMMMSKQFLADFVKKYGATSNE
jgi:hypothetical protein